MEDIACIRVYACDGVQWSSVPADSAHVARGPARWHVAATRFRCLHSQTGTLV